MVFSLMRMFHVVAAMWMVAGLAGRTFTLREARSSAEIAVVARLARLAGIFDRRFVIPGSMAVLLLGLVVAWAGGYPLFGFLQGSRSNWLFVSLVLFLATVPLVPAVFIPARRVFDRSLEEAVRKGEVTTALSAALRNPAVAWARRAELAIIATIVVLMILKPF